MEAHKHSEKENNFDRFYKEHRTNLEEVKKRREFQALMRDGQTSYVVNWKKVLYGSFGVAFLIKGIMILFR
jgi:hypothetical protein